MALVVAFFYAINRGFVKTRFSETIFIDASALFVFVSFSNSNGNSTTQMVTDNQFQKICFPTQMVTDNAKIGINVIELIRWHFCL